MLCLGIYLCTICMPGGPGSQKRVLGPLELELWMVISSVWMLEIEPKSSGRTSSILSYCAISPAPWSTIKKADPVVILNSTSFLYRFPKVLEVSSDPGDLRGRCMANVRGWGKEVWPRNISGSLEWFGKGKKQNPIWFFWVNYELADGVLEIHVKYSSM